MSYERSFSLNYKLEKAEHQRKGANSRLEGQQQHPDTLSFYSPKGLKAWTQFNI